MVSDLTPGLDGTPNRVGADHVLGISSRLDRRWPGSRSASRSAGRSTSAPAAASRPCTWPRHAREVVATDVNARALWITRLNARAQRRAERRGPRRVVLRAASRGEAFDLIATNPPFVISPATGERLVYRDSGLPGDRVVEDIVRAAPGHLTPGGWCQVLANWVVDRGRPWDERLAGWLEGCDAWSCSARSSTPATYVEMWLKDAGLQGGADYVRRYDTWLSWFEEQGIEAVGFGWINLRRTGVDGTRDPLQEWPYDVEQPVAPTIADWGAAVERLRGTDDAALAAAHLVARADVRQETVGQPGADDPETIVLRQQRGLRRARTVDTVEAALVGACDGDLSVEAILDALAGLLDLDPAEARTTYLPVVRDLVVEGFLVAD